MSAKEREQQINLQNFKIQKLHSLTVLTSDFNKPKLQTVRIVQQKFYKKLYNFRTQKIFSNSWTQKISEVFQTQKISELFGLRQNLHHRTQKFFNTGKILKKILQVKTQKVFMTTHNLGKTLVGSEIRKVQLSLDLEIFRVVWTQKIF